MTKIRSYILFLILCLITLVAYTTIAFSFTWQKLLKGQLINTVRAGQTGCVGAWVMNERGGDTVWDYSRNGKTATLVNCTYQADRIYVDTTGQIQLPPTIVGLTADSPYTLIINVEFSTLNNSEYLIGAWGASGARHSLGFINNSKLRYYVGNSAGADYMESAALAVNTAYMFALTFDGTTAKMYRNTILDDTLTPGGAVNRPVSFYICDRNDAAADGMTGWIYNIFYFNKAFLLSMIQNLYQEPYWLWGGKYAAGRHSAFAAAGVDAVNPIFKKQSPIFGGQVISSADDYLKDKKCVNY